MTKHRWLSNSTYLRVFCVFTNVTYILLYYNGEMINLTLTQKEIFYCRHCVSRPICLPPFTSRLPPTPACRLVIDSSHFSLLSHLSLSWFELTVFYIVFVPLIYEYESLSLSEVW